MSWSSVSGVLLNVLFMDEDLHLFYSNLFLSMFLSLFPHILIGSMHGEVSFYLDAKGTNKITAGCTLMSLHL